MELKITHTLIDKLTSLERVIAQLPRTAQHAAFYKKQAKDAQIQELLTIANSMELSLSPKDATTLLDAPEHGTIQQALRLLKNSVAVMRYARSVRENTFTSAILQHENKLLSDGFTDFWEEGKVRAPHEAISYLHDGLRNRPQQPHYQSWTEIRQELSFPGKIHPLILAGTMAYHLITSYPFAIFTLQTTLLATYTIVRPTRYWVSGTVSIVTAAWQAMNKTDFSFDPTTEQHANFVEKFVSNLLDQTTTIYDALEHQSSIAPEIRASLNDRQVRVLTYFKQHRKITRKKYASMMNIAIATAFRDLNDLMVKGLIKAVGSGRGTSYVIAELSTVGQLPNHDAGDTITDIQNNAD